MSAWQLSPAVRDLYSKHPEMHDLEAWELQSALFVLGYSDDLAAEAEIAAAAEVAHVDMTGGGSMTIPLKRNLYLPPSSRAILKKMKPSLKRGIMWVQTLVCSRRPCW
jgi:hypothetical protein